MGGQHCRNFWKHYAQYGGIRCFGTADESCDKRGTAGAARRGISDARLSGMREKCRLLAGTCSISAPFSRESGAVYHDKSVAIHSNLETPGCVYIKMVLE